MLDKNFIDMVDFAIKQLEIKTGDKILDFGCGRGLFVDLLRRKGFCAFGCDLLWQDDYHNEYMNDYIKCYHDGNRIPFKNDSFDAVFSYQVFEHVQKIEFYISELNRILSRGGGIYIEFPASYAFIDCHAGLPLLWIMQRVRNKLLKKWYSFLCIKFGYATKSEMINAWKASKTYLFYRSHKKVDNIFKENGFIVKNITKERRENRLLLDGIGTARELFRYKFFKEKGKSTKIGITVKIYLCFHALFYRLFKNRVLLLTKQ